jgi:hypothetical protein
MFRNIFSTYEACLKADGGTSRLLFKISYAALHCMVKVKRLEITAYSVL